MKSLIKCLLPVTIVLAAFSCEKENQPPEAAFTADTTLINEGEAVQFTDLSAYGPISWLWNFGDGDTSTAQNPLHTYLLSGKYDVILSVKNNYGSDTETKTNYIEVAISGPTAGTVNDYDGNTYATIRIGNQWWMAENLKTTHYSNGDSIPDGTGLGNIEGETYPDYQVAYDDNFENIPTYGRLYTWYAASDNRNVCPAGWHLPGTDDWEILADFLGENAGGKMKETGFDHWISPNTGATNESNFTALPGGLLDVTMESFGLGEVAYFWSSDDYGIPGASFATISYNQTSLKRGGHTPKIEGFAIRCIKDQ